MRKRIHPTYCDVKIGRKQKKFLYRAMGSKQASSGDEKVAEGHNTTVMSDNNLEITLSFLHFQCNMEEKYIESSSPKIY